MSFDALQLCLARWPAELFEVDSTSDALLGRIASVLEACKAAPRQHQSDLLPLLRQVLARESARRGRAVALRIPLQEGWPQPHEYAEHGIRVLAGPAGHLLIEAQAWRPHWLGQDAAEDLFADSFAERESRPSFLRPIDPAVGEATGYEHYSSPGQRAAIHAALLAKPGATLVITLPTGMGKSLVAQLPPLLAGEGACTIVVVPTIALAIDQARQFFKLWKRRHPKAAENSFAWHAGTPEALKQQIKHALRAGRQPILFTSPESVVGSLRMAIFDAARSGYLKYLVIDEAHLISQWGDSFRPEFQSLAAMRRALTKVSPGLKTVLKTATLTADALATIETLFSEGRPAELIASVNLRTEPRYWFTEAIGYRDQQRKVLEILRHAPRPLILYVTEVRKAKEWAQVLRDEGYARVGLFHGETGASQRQSLIDAWADDKLDIMVATAAFGVGIDKRDVRCIVHACVPESLDRYYQEVGRSGRDGLASTAIAVFTEEDLDTARGIAIPSLISGELGLPRWEEMLRHSVAGPGGRRAVNLSRVAPNLHRESEYNRAWNLRTLMLMARAGVITLEAEPDPGRGAEETAGELSADEVRRLFDTVLVHIRHPGHRDPAFWASHIEQARTDTMNVARSGLERMERVLRGRSEISQELRALYTIAQQGRHVAVSAACSGCPLCRAAQRQDLGILARPLVRPLYECDVSGLTRWRERFPSRATFPALILFDAADPLLLRRLEQLALQLRDCGMRELRASRRELPGVATWSVVRNPGAGSAGFVMLTDLAEAEDELAHVPRLTILRTWDSRTFVRLEQDGSRPFDWIVLPSDAADPHRPDRPLADLRHCIWLSAAIEAMSA